MTLPKINILVFFLFWSLRFTFAQAPSNDSCNKAYIINIPNGGFYKGTVLTDSVDLTNATIEGGENFHSSMVTTGLDRKSVWFKFYLPTRRGVKIELLQPSNVIATSDAGFTIFYGDTCLPNLSAIVPAKITPINQFGNSFNPCIDPGWYIVQVSAKSRANGKIYLSLTFSYPYESPFALDAKYDDSDSAYSFGNTIGYNGTSKNAAYLKLGCYTIKDTTEYLKAIGSDYKEYEQSAWLVYQTINTIDQIYFYLRRNNWGNMKVGLRIYEGDCRQGGHNKLKLIDSGLIINASCAYNYSKYLTITCNIDSGAFYTVQLLFQKDLSEDLYFYIESHRTKYRDGASKPIKSQIIGNNNLGILPNSGSINKEFGWTCNNYLKNNLCGKANTDSIMNGKDMTHWIGFELQTVSNITITPGCLARLILDSADVNCNDIDTIGAGEFSTSINRKCLPKGKYLIQLLQKDTARCSYSYGDLDRYYNPFGSDFNVRIIWNEVKDYNHFSLSDSGRIDSIYSIKDTIKPLPQATWVISKADTFGCEKTILPLDHCDSIWDRAIYRTFIIGDVDNDNVLDSGLLRINNMAHSRPGGGVFTKRIYRGNAIELAQNQSAFRFNDTLKGLNPFGNCQNTINSYQDVVGSVCVTPGEYTFITFANENDVGVRDQPRFKFEKQSPKYHTPNQPQILDTLQPGKTYYTERVAFTCLNNADSIDGVKCGNKAVYHVFYIDNYTTLKLQMFNTSNCIFSLYNGDIRSSKIKLYKDINGSWNCTTSMYADLCNPISPGWYTLVTWNSEWSYSDSIVKDRMSSSNGDIYSEKYWYSQVKIDIGIIPQPLYNRPFKAAKLNNGQPLDFGNTNSNTFPITGKTYSFPSEVSNCIPDTPFKSHPITPCKYDHIAYFIFELKRESYLKIRGVTNNIPYNQKTKLFNFDVSKDSLLMDSILPIQNCNYDARWLEYCRLQPGKYTVVLFYPGNSNLNSISAYVDSVGFSRFDFASNAYDFDLIPGDSVWRGGKIGDKHPTDSLRLPSNDFFFCTTGSAFTDPTAGCTGYFNPNIYPSTKNQALFPFDSAYTYKYGKNNYYYWGSANRNLWYTFRLKGKGSVSCRLKVNGINVASNTEVGMTLFKSDKNGALDFDSLRSLGFVDSSLNLGIIQLGKSYYGSNNTHCYFYNTLSSNGGGNVECDTNIYTRYYLLLDLPSSNSIYQGLPTINKNVEVEILYDSIEVRSAVYDNYSTAQKIDGDLFNTSNFHDSVLVTQKVYSGSRAHFYGTTTDTSDYHNNTSCGKLKQSYWYKFYVDSSGYINIGLRGYRLNSSNGNWGLFNNFLSNSCALRLLKSTKDGDSLSGLENVPFGGNNYIFNKVWGRACVSQGWYYINIQNKDFECLDYIYPEFFLDYHPADFCNTSANLVLTGLGTVSKKALLSCHTIGTDYGEDGSNMGCLQGPSGLKSTWFKIEYTDTTKINITFSLKNYTNVAASEIRYRAFYGNCSSLTPAPCNTNAQSSFTLNCMTIGLYYIQVVSPNNSTGEIEVIVTASKNTDTTCNPVNIWKPTANYYSELKCPKNVVYFYNSSTRGDSISYFWDFGNGNTDTSINPIVAYPKLLVDTSYNIFLKVSHKGNGFYDTISQYIFVPATPIVIISPKPDTAICFGDSIILKSYVSFGARKWSTNDTTEFIIKKSLTNTWYKVQTVKDNCVMSDSVWIKVNALPIVNLGKDTILCNYDSLTLKAGDGFTSYLWNNNTSANNLIVIGAGKWFVEVKDSNQCKNSDTIIISKSSVIDSLLKFNYWSCKDKDTMKLIPLVKGGFYYNSIYTDSTGTFSVKTATVGLSQVNYKYKDTKGCWFYDSSIVTIFDLPNASISLAGPFCKNSGLQLIKAAINMTGKFSGGAFVDSTGNFNPWSANAGTHKVIYSIRDSNSCINKDSTLVIVDSIPSAAISVAGPFCKNGGMQKLNPKHSPGGFFSGVAFIDSMGNFNPWVANAGDHKVFYNFTDGNTCSNKDSIVIRVDTIPNVAIVPAGPCCKNGGIKKITPSFNSGGKFSGGSFIDSAGNFNPWTANVGIHKIYYTFKDGNLCSNADSTLIKVDSIPDASIISAGPFCKNGGFQKISPVFNIGGKFSGGAFIDSAGFFNPLLAGVGLHKIYYTFKDGNSCINKDSTFVRVDSIPNAAISDAGPFCKNGGMQKLNPKHSPGGFFSGGFYIDSLGDFNPWVANAGDHKVFYNFTDGNNCSNRDSLIIHVDTIPNAAIVPAGPFCKNGGMQKITPFFNSGGKFSGGSFIDSAGNFNPWMADVGIHQIYYTFKDGNLCSNTDSTVVRVDSIPNASIISAGPFCNLDTSFQLLLANKALLTKYYGSGLNDSSGLFYPNKAIIGSNKIFVLGVDSKKCNAIDSTIIIVFKVPDSRVNPVPDLCVDMPIFQLIPIVNGGVFSGVPFVSNAGLFEPTKSGVGSYKIYYERTVDGCFGKDSVDITVRPLPIPQVTVLPDSGCEPLRVVFQSKGGFVNKWVVKGAKYYDSIFENTFANGLYPVSLQITNQFNCSINLTDTIVVYEKPRSLFDFEPKDIYSNLTLVDFINQSVGPYNKSRWYIDSFNFGNSTDANYMFPDTGYYLARLIVESPFGCLDTSNVRIYVFDKFNLFIPSAITVNGDNINDIFRPRGTGVEKMEFEIFNRWGEKIYEGNDSWDATYRGEIVMQGIYVYLIKVTDTKGMFHYFKGTVNVIR